jgi:hypothetical protein
VIELLGSVLLMWAGWMVLQRSRNSGSPLNPGPQPGKELELRRRFEEHEREFRARLKILDEQIARIGQYQPDELTQAVLKDSMLREERARTALEVVLFRHGYSQDQIDEILSQVEGNPESSRG